MHVAVDCPGSTPDVSIDFNIYIDPSGKVVDANTGQAISGATVTLLRSDNASGPFIPVADGSAVMSAANRNNPDTTASDGTFGWDVIAGYYVVRASSATCGSVDSAVMNIPPPVTNLVLGLTCPHNLTVSKQGAGTGTVTSSPAGIDCGSTCIHAFGYGTSVTLNAAPAAGSRFVGWSGGSCSGSGSCAVTVNANTTVTATFGKIANLTVAKQGAGTGKVTSSPAGIDCGSNCVNAFDSGTRVTLSAVPAAGSRFGGWSGGGCSGSGSCAVTLTANTTVTATFNKVPVVVVSVQTRITKAKINSGKRTATFKFVGSGGSKPYSFQCKLDKSKKYSSCRSGKTYKHLKPGKHTFWVRAKDHAGRLDKTPAIKKFKIKR